MLACPKKRGQPFSFPLILFSPSLASFFIFCNYLPRQRRKSGQEGVDLEGLQAGLEKLAMKPKVLNSKVVPPPIVHRFFCQGSPLKLNENEMKEVKDMADSQSSAMRR